MFLELVEHAKRELLCYLFSFRKPFFFSNSENIIKHAKGQTLSVHWYKVECACELEEKFMIHGTHFFFFFT